MNSESARKYRSPLREGQAEATAFRIIEAAIRILEGGLAGLSIPAVAREAGVSVPTVYHHFADKTALIRALSDHLDRTIGIDPPANPHSAAELAAHIRYVGPHLHGRPSLLGQALAGPEGTALRREWLAERSAMVRGALRSGSTLPEDDFERLVSIATVLCTSQTLGVLTEYLGLAAGEAAEAVAWAVLKLTEENTP